MTDYSTSTTEKRKRSWSAWRDEDTRPVPLCKGVEIDSSVYEISENRYITLIIKGFIVYLITAGGIGAYLTALAVDFNQIIFNLVILATAIICAILYHSWKSENLGYLVFFFAYAAFIFMFKDYLNSGFYAILNSTIDWASIYFDTKGLQYYNERIANRYATITITAIIIGIAMNVLLNNYILRRARYMIAIGLSLAISIMTFYMELEPDTIYSVMVLAGIAMTFVLKCGRHFHLSRRDHIFARSKKGLTYALDFRSLWQGMAIIGLVVLTIVGTMSVVYDKMYYDSEQRPSEYKIASRETFQNFIMLGIFGLIDFYPNNGGLSTGELGGVSSIRLDYQTDITITYTPYSTDMLYIRNFVGDTYLPYDNRWIYGVTGEKEYLNSSGYSNELRVLKNAYEEGDEYSAKGYMTVTNVAGSPLTYQPYYSDSDRMPLFIGQTTTYTYYPRNDNESLSEISSKPESHYLEVPKENKKVIDEFIKEAGIKDGTPEEIVQQIADYYAENIPYTIRPGATPYNEDFVNFFLTENKKGYCAHFASAATLILREMGVPARYCEGYAISFTQAVSTGELIETEKYSDHFDGYNALGDTGVVRVDATDADAHAWVEIYDGDKGWTQVEVTPPSGLEEEEEEDSFWDSFSDLFGDGDSEDANYGVTNTDRFSLSGADKIMRYVAFAMIVILIIGILVFTGVKLWPALMFRIDYSRAGISDKLILKYSRFIKKKKKKDERFRDKMNYAEQLMYLVPGDEALRLRLEDILERAGFSNKEISQEEFDVVDRFIEELSKKKEG